MAHYSYLDELNKKSRKIKVYWLILIVVISLAIIGLLVIIRNETNFFVTIQEQKVGLTNEERLEIEGRVLAGWAKRDLGLAEKDEVESRVLGSETNLLSENQRINIEKRLIE